MTALKSLVTGRIIVAEWPDGRKALALTVTIDCPECGQIEMQLPGHHLRPLRDLCIEAIDRYPELAGSDAGLEVLKRTEFVGKANDPERS